MDLTFLQVRKTITLYTFEKNKAEQGDRDAKRELPLRKCFISLCYSLSLGSSNRVKQFWQDFYVCFILPVEVSWQVSFSVFYNQVYVFYKDMEHFVPIINTKKIPS